MYILTKGKHTQVEEINNETIEIETNENISNLETETTTEEIGTTEIVGTEPITIDYTTLLQQTNYYLNFLIAMFVLFLMLNFVERK